MTSKSLSTRPQPLPVKGDLVCQHRGEVVVTWTGVPGTPGSLTTKQIVDSLAGGSAVWDRVQFHRIDVYGAEIARTSTNAELPWPSLTVTLNSTVNSNYLGDQPTFYCDAVGGSRRAHVGIRPNSLFSNAWIPSDQNGTLLSILTEPTLQDTANAANSRYSAVVQFTLVLRSTVGTVSEPLATTVQGTADRVNRKIQYALPCAEAQEVIVINSDHNRIPVRTY